MQIKKEKLVEYLTQLIRFRTFSEDQEVNLLALKWVKEQLDPLGLHFQFHAFNGYPSLVITTCPTKQPKLWLMAHIDVVSAPEALFNPKISGCKYSARGAYDMKMAIACYLLLMQELKDSLTQYDIGMMLTSDEEMGGLNGTKRLLEEGYSSQVAFLPDGGFDWNFEEEAKGVLRLRIRSHGESAHGSRPWEGENAIVKLMRALEAINLLFDTQKAGSGDYYPTVNVGIIQGGSQVNQVPAYAEAFLDIRFPPAMCVDKIQRDIAQISQSYGVCQEKLFEASPNKVDLSLSFFRTFRAIAQKAYGIEVGKMSAHGSSDARFFGEKGIPVLIIAPKGGDIHSDQEWVDLDDLVRFYEVMKEWVMINGII